MTELVAKPIVKNQFWIVTDGEKKVGNIEANNAGYSVNLNGSFFQFDSTTDIKKNTKIKFENLKTIKTNNVVPYSEYPTPKKIYNSIVDVQKGLHLFTKTKKSKCYHVAGYFIMEHSQQEEVIFCPKYIFVQRYKYKGPFKTEAEANLQINT